MNEKIPNTRGLRTSRERGVAMVLVMLLAVISSILVGGLATTLLNTSRQSRVSASYEEAYGSCLGAINKILFQMEAAMGGSNPPASLVDLEPYLTSVFGNSGHTGTVTYTGTIDGTAYTVKLTDPAINDQEFQLSAEVAYGGSTRTVVALVRGPDIVEALRYAIFGNFIHFDNHAHVNWGLNLLTTVYSNSGVEIDKGVKISGVVQAANYVSANTGPASGDAGVPDTILTVTAEQGDPDPSPVVASAPVTQVVPGPSIKEFPSFDFIGVKTRTDALGRTITASEWATMIDAARAYAVSKPNDNAEYALPDTHASCPGGDCYPGTLTAANIPISVIHRNPGTPRIIRVPNVDNPTYSVELGTTAAQCPAYPCASGTNSGDTYEIIFKHQGHGTANDTRIKGNDSMLYILGDAEIAEPLNTLVRVEGSIAVDGGFKIKSAAEILSWENRQAPWFEDLDHSIYDQDDDGVGDFASNISEVNVGAATHDLHHSRYPALAANGKVKIDGSDGPAHIEGIVYSNSESHLHRSAPHAPAYSVGSEIADVVHNCQFFSFAYDAESMGELLGFYERLSARPVLKIIRLEDF